jgi:hypothetical protein
MFCNCLLSFCTMSNLFIYISCAADLSFPAGITTFDEELVNLRIMVEREDEQPFLSRLVLPTNIDLILNIRLRPLLV